MATKTTPSRVAKALLETADDLHRSGLLTADAHRKITMRHVGSCDEAAQAPMNGDEVRRLRAEANVSQVVFARYLNVTPGYVSQLERGTKQPSGAALALLNVIRRKGIAVVR